MQVLHNEVAGHVPTGVREGTLPGYGGMALGGRVFRNHSSHVIAPLHVRRLQEKMIQF